MKSDQYFIEALKNHAYLNKEWIIGTLAVTVDGMPKTDGKTIVENHSDYPYRLFKHIDDREYYFLNADMSGWLKIEGTDISKPLLSVFDQLTLPKLTLANQFDEMITSVGNAICNAVVLCYPFEGRIPYINDKFGEYIDDIVASKLASSADDKDPDKINTEQLLKYHEALGLIEGLTQVTCPSITQKAILPNQELRKFRDKFYADKGDAVKDPTVLAMAKAEMEKIDRAYLKGDDAENFYISGKYYSVTRMKMHGTYGQEHGFGEIGDDAPVIKKAISEGLDLDNLPALFDSIRSASNSRGVLTALGGAGMKYIARIFQNSMIVMDECGTKTGFPLNIVAIDLKEQVGRYAIDEKGQTFMLTMPWLKQNIGKTITVRTPQACIAGKPSYCAHCLDANKIIRKNGLYLIPMDVASVMQNNDMKAMHGRKMSAVEIDLTLAIC